MAGCDSTGDLLRGCQALLGLCCSAGEGHSAAAARLFTKGLMLPVWTGST